MKGLIQKLRKAFAIFFVRRSALQLPKDQELVDKIVYELNDYHDMKTQADPNEEGYAIGIIEEVLKHYA